MGSSEPFRLFMDGSEKALVVVAQQGQKSESAIDVKARETLERMFPLVNQVVDKFGKKYADLDEIYVTLGPGSNTGLRMSLTQARVFFALKPAARIFGATTFEVLFRASGLAEAIVLVSDRHESFFYAVYENGAKVNEGHAKSLAEIKELDDKALVFSSEDELAKQVAQGRAKSLAIPMEKALLSLDAYTEYSPNKIQDLVPDYTEKI